MSSQATILIIPGLRDHVKDHWQTHLHTALSKTRKVHTVEPLQNDKLSCAARVQAIERAMQAIDGPVIPVAHSGGVIMLVHWAQTYRHNIPAALLAAPADLASPLPEGYPTLQALQANGWLPLPRTRLPFPSLVVASTNDPLASLSEVERMASDWGSELFNAGAVGHLNPASGFSQWPLALDLIARLESSQTLAEPDSPDAPAHRTAPQAAAGMQKPHLE